MRESGLDSVISLPQIVVCGDQSSGKSSVLEAITKIPFPKKDNLCTRFATEIVLRRAAQPSVSTIIIPDKFRPAEERTKLEGFEQVMSVFSELPALIDVATEMMAIGTDREDTRAFAKDVLSIQIEGSDRPQLTMVDLPGPVYSENKAQSKQDVEFVWELVQKYISESRTVILAVLSAQNDYASQVILSRCRKVDGKGDRTLGVITKPDCLPINSESEAAFVSLAKNEDASFNWAGMSLRIAGTMNEASVLKSENTPSQTSLTHANGRAHHGTRLASRPEGASQPVASRAYK